jgi:hypothetical protein
VLGVSTLVVILGTPSPRNALHVFDRAWSLMALTGTAAALTGLALGRVRPGYGVLEAPREEASAPPVAPAAAEHTS